MRNTACKDGCLYACNESSCVVPVWESLILERTNVLDTNPFPNVNVTKNTHTECRVFKTVAGKCLLYARVGNRKYLSWGNSSQTCRWCFVPSCMVIWGTQCEACFNEFHLFSAVRMGKNKNHTVVGSCLALVDSGMFDNVQQFFTCPRTLLLRLWHEFSISNKNTENL